MYRILILEDDEYIAELERDFLQASSCAVDICGDGKAGEKMFFDGKYDLVILDLMLPGKDGVHICRSIREKSSVPIIMITAKKEDIDKVRGLSVGADDYMVKPFSPTEMVARVRAHIGIHERIKTETESQGQDKKKSRDRIRFGNLEVFPGGRKVWKDGQEVILTNKEFDLLEYFIENPDIALSKERIFDRIWGFDAVGDLSTVTVHVGRLREKIENNPAIPERIQTVWGVGYRFELV